MSHDDLYEWDEFADHLWLASDSANHVGVFTCAEARALPCWLQIPRSNLESIEHELLALPAYTSTKVVNNVYHEFSRKYRRVVREWGERGLYYFDFPLNVKTAEYYIEVVRPREPLSLPREPLGIMVLAAHVRVAQAEFGRDRIRWDMMESNGKGDNENLADWKA